MASFGLLLTPGNPVGSGGLYTPMALAFGPDGNLYITGGTFGGGLGVRRYHPTTGAFIDLFAETGDQFIPLGLAFGPDQHLYVATGNSSVMRFNSSTGAFMDHFVPAGGGGLAGPFHLTFGAAAAAPILTYTLHRDCLDNVDDPAGRWQIEGGKVLEHRKHVANYSSVKRISCGTKELNTAQLWMTIFFLGGHPPENLTLHGAHDFGSGGEIGSVSAASPAFSAQDGKPFKRVGNTLTIG
jgi:hypothetical protein